MTERTTKPSQNRSMNIVHRLFLNLFFLFGSNRVSQKEKVNPTNVIKRPTFPSLALERSLALSLWSFFEVEAVKL
ncbi:hypothetical protein L3X38_027886 [Prunus dulcis]|uniref:Uncharacterized protein n=1 Tax=Prunus dulcis TaxID=3755 RepID=A0AAD4VQB1_PRUDU|nr:hypothetical protein L3X38_027886 [Prunus dulcis]